jgi:hypothetical protein
LAARPAGGVTVRVAEAAGGLACLVLVWPVDGGMPTARGSGAHRAGGGNGAGTVAKALAELTAAGELVN